MADITADTVLAAITAGADDIYAVAAALDVPHASATLRTTVIDLAAAGRIDITPAVGAPTLTPA